eukprot:TRINITY_DN4812_c3_g1_i1.p1 TRINITY_DN4812_c3_g1~~TRINITY_DN4812_c3_g1_i1.p1  ORF type:complete len:821 (+),score=189.89 TRINITY_DN4812_c3_g1_i1:78-2540(+)
MQRGHNAARGKVSLAQRPPAGPGVAAARSRPAAERPVASGGIAPVLSAGSTAATPAPGAEDSESAPSAPSREEASGGGAGSLRRGSASRTSAGGQSLVPPLRPLSAPPGGRHAAPPKLRGARGLRLPTPTGSARTQPPPGAWAPPEIDLLLTHPAPAPAAAAFVACATATANAAGKLNEELIRGGGPAPGDRSGAQAALAAGDPAEAADADHERTRRRIAESLAALDAAVASLRDKKAADGAARAAREAEKALAKPAAEEGPRRRATEKLQPPRGGGQQGARATPQASAAAPPAHPPPAATLDSDEEEEPWGPIKKFGATQRVAHRIEALRRMGPEYLALQARVAKHRSRAKEHQTRLQAEGNDWVLGNAVVMGRLGPARGWAQLEGRRQRGIMRHQRATENHRRVRDEKYERAWRTVFKSEISRSLAGVEEMTVLRQQEVNTWALISCHARFLAGVPEQLDTRIQQRESEGRQKTAAATISRFAHRWVREIRRRKARRCWRLLRLHLAAMYLWEDCITRRRAVGIVINWIHAQKNVFRFATPVLRYLRGVKKTQRLFRWHQRRKQLFVGLARYQFNRVEEIFIARDEHRRRKLLKDVASAMDAAAAEVAADQKGRRGGSMDSPNSPSGLARCAGSFRGLASPRQRALNPNQEQEDAILRIADKYGLRVPEHIKLAAIHNLLQEAQQAHSTAMEQWVEAAENVQYLRQKLELIGASGASSDEISAQQSAASSRPILRMVWPRAAMEQLVTNARQTLCEELMRHREELLSQGVSGEGACAGLMKDYKSKLWQKGLQAAAAVPPCDDLPDRFKARIEKALLS